jgi:uncharacterized sulfatase
VRSVPHYLRDMGYRVVIAGKTHIAPVSAFPFEFVKNSNVMPPGKQDSLYLDLDTSTVERLLKDHDRGRPLCLVVGSHSPHVHWPANEGYDPARIEVPPYLLDTAEIRQMRCRYYTDVSCLDKQVGEVMDALARHGYAQNTLFIYTHDHGAQWPFAKWNLYDAGIRSPLLIRWSGRVWPGSSSRAMVSLIDLLPTMLQAAGGNPPTDIDGRSFLPVLLGQSDHHRQMTFASHTGDGKTNRAPMRCIRTEQYKYILNLAPQETYTAVVSDAPNRDSSVYWQSWERLAQVKAHAARRIEYYRHRPSEELYNVREDPFELNNLAGDAAYACVLDELGAKLKAWRLQQGEDVGKVAMPQDARHGSIPYGNW